jgi:transposase InsO family protein
MAPACLIAQLDDPAWLLQARYGHLHFRALCEMSKKGLVRGMPVLSHVDEFCDGCALGKPHRTPFPQSTTFRADHSLELVHIDLCGPITPATVGGNKYFLLVVDDHTRFMWIEVIRTKDEAFARFRKIRARGEVQGKCKLFAFRSDCGGEFNLLDFKAYCDEGGVRHFTTAPYSPQQNGVVERRNQTVVEMARCMLKSMTVPAEFWGEAVHTAMYLLNCSLTRSLKG